MTFHQQKIVRFGHCDPAGILFFQRYIELCHEVFEDWLKDGLHLDFRNMQEHQCLTLTAVNVQADFKHPSVYGETLNFTLAVERIGNTSMTILIEVDCEGQARMNYQFTPVLVSLDTMKSVRIDQGLRDKINPFLNTSNK